MNDIIPYCIYHYIDPDTKTFLGCINTPKIDANGKFICQLEEPKIHSKWIFAGIFYAISPKFRPIPKGMKMFCIKKNLTFLHDIQDLILVYDPYNIKDDCVYFITYNQPVPNTEPLYFHKVGNYVFPSFDSTPPSKNQNWESTQISPIFVMTPSTFDKSSSIRFRCFGGRCLPWVKNILGFLDIDGNKKSYNLRDCIDYCDGLKNNTSNILDVVSKHSKKVLNRKKAPLVIIILIIFCIFIFWFKFLRENI